MFTVENKFEIGEECFTCYRKPTKYECHICKGEGEFLYNDYKIHCRNCNGTGKLHNPKQYVLDTCKVKVRSIKVSLNFEGVVSVHYNVNPGSSEMNIKKRGEDNLFRYAEKAEEYCRAVNQKEISPLF